MNSESEYEEEEEEESEGSEESASGSGAEEEDEGEEDEEEEDPETLPGMKPAAAMANKAAAAKAAPSAAKRVAPASPMAPPATTSRPQPAPWRSAAPTAAVPTPQLPAPRPPALKPSHPRPMKKQQQQQEQQDVCGEEEGEVVMTQEDMARRRQENIQALVDNKLEVTRAPLMSRYLTLQQAQATLKRAFVSPRPGAPAVSDEMRRRLAGRKFFVPWGSQTPFVPPAVLRPPPAPEPEPAQVVPPPPSAPPKVELPEGIEPLVLWSPPPPTEGAPPTTTTDAPIVVDPMLVRWLRPHQREGVAFMFECVTGLRLEGGRGCILADDMGLGKTLQGLALLWTLSTQGAEALGGTPLARRSLIVCPTSLVSNWDSEATKWLQGRVRTLALCEAGRDDVVAGIKSFLSPACPYHVLIISYETFRLHADRFAAPGSCDLLICDEAHRLKNDATLTNRALDSLPCARRVLLSGTPMQNHLDEFFAMVDFCNPGVLGTPPEFRRRFEAPILAGREPGAAADVVEEGAARSAELSGLVNAFILRRTNALLSAHLPPKVVQVVCCRLTPLQHAIYCHFLESKAARKILGGRGSSGVLPAISNLKKLCNHPKLIYDAVHSKVPDEEGGGKKGGKGGAAGGAAGFEGVAALFPPCLFDDGRPGRGGMAVGWEAASGKFGLCARMLEVLWGETDDRVVIVSNYTQTLDLFGALCRERNYPCLRLDGSTSISKREKLVKAFNDQTQSQFVFLLSSKAGGCGLNLVGGNRLILYDVDWNPAVDKQAAARVWRDGQKRRVYVYRLLAAGTIEEKVFQRQISKEGLQALVNTKSAGAGGGSGGGAGGGGKGAAKNLMSAEELRELFSLQPDTLSHTYEVVLRQQVQQQQQQARSKGDAGGDGDDEEMGDAQRPMVNVPLGTHVLKAQVGKPLTEEELGDWGHHSDPTTVPDTLIARVAADDVSFVFSCAVDGKEGVEDTVFRLGVRALAGASKGLVGGRSGGLAGMKRPAATLPLAMRGKGGAGSSVGCRTAPGAVAAVMQQHLQSAVLGTAQEHSGAAQRALGLPTTTTCQEQAQAAGADAAVAAMVAAAAAAGAMRQQHKQQVRHAPSQGLHPHPHLPAALPLRDHHGHHSNIIPAAAPNMQQHNQPQQQQTDVQGIVLPPHLAAAAHSLLAQAHAATAHTSHKTAAGDGAKRHKPSAAEQAVHAGGGYRGSQVIYIDDGDE